jgi:hypothetical protein
MQRRNVIQVTGLKPENPLNLSENTKDSRTFQEKF